MHAKSRICRWSYTTVTDEISVVFPDGCRDVLIIRRKEQRPVIFLTSFDIRPRRVILTAGLELTGFRLYPGSSIRHPALKAISEDVDRAEQVLENALSCGDDMEDAIFALAQPGSTVKSVATHIGVSVRTMQRQFSQRGLPAPDYWRLLARARRAAGLLKPEIQLADIADRAGFSDQAHMTREFLRWFDLTPNELRRDPASLELLSQPALATWTGEQISTR